MILGAQVNLRTKPTSRTPEEVLSRARGLTQSLAWTHSLLKSWYALPSGPADKYVSLQDADALLGSMRSRIESSRSRFGHYEELGASLMLANVDNDRDWRKPGVVVLDLNPTSGRNSFSIKGIAAFGEAASSVMLNALIESVKAIQPEFACTDVKARTLENELVNYQISRRLYQHRQFFGWMGFVPAQITHAQIRDAHSVHPVDGLGTVIVSVPGVFDPTDDAQVDKVHRVEMDLASYDLLPVTDPHFKG